MQLIDRSDTSLLSVTQAARMHNTIIISTPFVPGGKNLILYVEFAEQGVVAARFRLADGRNYGDSSAPPDLVGEGASAFPRELRE
jgi:hypothetical protein